MLVKLYRLATTSQPGSRGRRHYYVEAVPVPPTLQIPAGDDPVQLQYAIWAACDAYADFPLIVGFDWREPDGTLSFYTVDHPRNDRRIVDAAVKAWSEGRRLG